MAACNRQFCMEINILGSSERSWGNRTGSEVSAPMPPIPQQEGMVPTWAPDLLVLHLSQHSPEDWATL